MSSLVHNKGEVDFNDLMSERKDLEVSIFAPQLYSNSKLANALFNKELGKRLKGTGVQTYALCPGMVMTDIGRNFDLPFYVLLLYPILRFIHKNPSQVFNYLFVTAEI